MADPVSGQRQITRDDSDGTIGGRNLKANEFLNRRLTVEDAAEAHVVALEKAPAVGFGVYIVSAPPPFGCKQAEALIADAPSVIARYFPDAAELYARAGWRLPQHIDRVYDPSLAEAELGLRCRTDFSSVLGALLDRRELPFVHDPSYVSPKEKGERI